MIKDYIDDLFYRMFLLRKFEEACVKILEEKKTLCPVHLYMGQEAVAAGVSSCLSDNDYVFSTHRSHGHYLAKGGDPSKLMAEILCRKDGCSYGYGGSMHVRDAEKGFIASSAIVAGSIPLAVGAALSLNIQQKNNISVAFFGDGAMDEGVTYESFNLACLYKLPILFVCENNLFSTHLPIYKRHANQDLSEKAKSFGLKTKRVNGNDAEEVRENASQLIEYIKSKEGPAFLECMTFRWLAHVGYEKDLDVGFRKKEDVFYWMERCPIKLIKTRYPERDFSEIEIKVEQIIKDALLFAENSSYPECEGI